VIAAISLTATLSLLAALPPMRAAGSGMLAPSLVSLVSLASLPSLTAAPLALAFGAGVFAVFNPCGFALLPAFVSYTAGRHVSPSLDERAADDETPVATRLLRGLGLGVPLTAGFLLVFLVAGGILSVGGQALARVFPWLSLLMGLALVVLGVWMFLPGTALEVPVLSRVAAVVSGTRGAGAAPQLDAADCCNGNEEGVQMSGRGAVGVHPARAAWGFGLGYGISSLGCTLPIFLLVVGSAIATGGLAQAAVVFAAYGAGMAIVLLGVALVATTLGDVLRQSLLPLLRWVQPLSALLIVAAGVYIVVYQLRAGLLLLH